MDMTEQESVEWMEKLLAAFPDQTRFMEINKALVDRIEELRDDGASEREARDHERLYQMICRHLTMKAD